MKILHLTSSHTGGAGIAALRLHKMLLKQGVHSSFLSKTLHDIENSCYKIDEVYPATSRIKTVCRNVMERVTPYTGSNSKKSLLLLKNKPNGYELFTFPNSNLYVEECKLVKEADIIHLHWIADDFINYQTFFPSIKNKAIVWTLHDMNPFTGGCHHADSCTNYRYECKNCPQLPIASAYETAFTNQELKRSIYSNLLPEKVRIVTPSNWLKDLSITSVCFNSFSHQQIPNPVDSRIFKYINQSDARQKLNLPLNKKIILFVAHNIENVRKGIPLLVNAVTVLNNKDILLCAAGTSSESADWLNLGYINSDEKMMLAYNAADVFVLPSMAENYPNTIIESLLCGTPVVASATGGIPEQVTDNGILFPPGDELSLVNALLTVLQKSGTEIKSEIRKSALQMFNEEDAIKKYIEVYKEVSA